MVCDAHLAEDVTQGVFLALAKSAGDLKDRPVLSGWLHRTAQNIAAQTVRTDARRRFFEQQAAAMNLLLSAESETPPPVPLHPTPSREPVVRAQIGVKLGTEFHELSETLGGHF